jgi:hypothetical protein
LSPASHPAIAGSSRAKAPISVRRATVLPELLRITADASSIMVAGGMNSLPWRARGLPVHYRL